MGDGTAVMRFLPILFMLDGKTGDVLDCHQISEGVIEASPAVYQSYMVVGTRDCKIWGMELQ